MLELCPCSWFLPIKSGFLWAKHRFFKNWANKALNCFIDITEKGLLIDKIRLETKFDGRIRFQYLQLQSLILKTSTQQALKRSLTAFKNILNMEDSSTGEKLSLIYKILLSFDKKASKTKITQWSRDCEIIFSAEDWAIINNIINNPFMVTTSLLNIKLLSLDRMQHFSPNAHVSWKGCDTKTNYIHCWWHCRVIQKFWNTICIMIKEITGCLLPYTPRCILLNNWKLYYIPVHLRQTGYLTSNG